MPKCVWPSMVTCVWLPVMGFAQVPPDEIPMSDAARGTIPNRFQQTTAEEIIERLPIPRPFDLRTASSIRPAPGAPLVSAAALRHKVPKDAKKAYDRGLKALQAGEFDRALEQLQRAVALDSQYALAYSNLGVALVRQQRLTEAEIEIRHAIALDPYVHNGHSNLAWVLAGLGKRDEAAAMARRAIEIAPDNESALTLLGQLQARRPEK